MTASTTDNPTPSHATIIDLAFYARSRMMRVALPGRVESYDAATQKANVQPLIMDEDFDDLGERVAQRLPVVTNVPVCFPGAGGYRVTFPMAIGNTVLLVFSSSSLDRWLSRGGEVDPEDDRHHHISDAVAIPGLFDFAHVPTSAPTDAMVLHAATLKLGADDASDPVVRKSDLDQVVATFNGHHHLYNPGPGALAPTAAPTEQQSAIACSPVVRSK